MIDAYVRRQTQLHPHETTEKGRFTGFNMDCPVCHKAHHVSMRASTGKWTCFSCGAAGDAADFVAAIQRCTIYEARRLVRTGEVGGGTYGHVDQLTALAACEVDEQPEFLTCGLPPEYQPVETHPYLESRLVTPDETQRHFLGMCTYGKYAGRIIIPIIEHGDVLGFIARDYLGRYSKTGKILNPNISISNMVWNIDTTLVYSRVVVCEGVFSALRVGDDAVATFGKNFSHWQMLKLKEHGVREIVLLFDSDVDYYSSWLMRDGRPVISTQTGRPLRNPMPRKLRILADMFTLRLVTLHTGDPGDHPRSVLRTLIDDAPVFGNRLSTLISL